MKVAASLFVKHGYLNTSVRDIANKCNMNVATLYHYIGSKEKILGLFQEYTTEQMKSIIEKHRETIYTLNPSRRPGAHDKALYEMGGRIPGRNGVLVPGIQEPHR